MAIVLLLGLDLRHVFESSAGGTLEDSLRDGPLAPAQAVSVVVARLADALAALHERRILQGDVKPSNIGFTAEGAPKLLDFGLAHEVRSRIRRQRRTAVAEIDSVAPARLRRRFRAPLLPNIGTLLGLGRIP